MCIKFKIKIVFLNLFYICLFFFFFIHIILWNGPVKDQRNNKLIKSGLIIFLIFHDILDGQHKFIHTLMTSVVSVDINTNTFLDINHLHGIYRQHNKYTSTNNCKLHWKKIQSHEITTQHGRFPHLHLKSCLLLITNDLYREKNFFWRK